MAARARAALADDGLCLVVEPHVGDPVADELILRAALVAGGFGSVPRVAGAPLTTVLAARP